MKDMAVSRNHVRLKKLCMSIMTPVKIEEFGRGVAQTQS